MATENRISCPFNGTRSGRSIYIVTRFQYTYVVDGKTRKQEARVALML